MLNLFSESVHVTIEDIHFIVGPNNSAVNKDTDWKGFKGANEEFKGDDPLYNLEKMMKKVIEEEKKEREDLDAKEEELRKLKVVEKAKTHDERKKRKE